jgi:hypothetical protein
MSGGVFLRSMRDSNKEAAMANAKVSKSILMVLQCNRQDTAARVQKVFTGFGCIIRTRIGLHDGVGNTCSNQGLILLELIGELVQQKNLAAALKRIRGVKAKLVKVPF